MIAELRRAFTGRSILAGLIGVVLVLAVMYLLVATSDGRRDSLFLDLLPPVAIFLALCTFVLGIAVAGASGATPLRTYFAKLATAGLVAIALTVPVMVGTFAINDLVPRKEDGLPQTDVYLWGDVQALAFWAVIIAVLTAWLGVATTLLLDKALIALLLGAAVVLVGSPLLGYDKEAIGVGAFLLIIAVLLVVPAAAVVARRRAVLER
ncbi:hypothetical protein [Kribbella endophytica]